MSASQGASKKEIVFIVGDPKSEQNSRRIRQHASKRSRPAEDLSPTEPDRGQVSRSQPKSKQTRTQIIEPKLIAPKVENSREASPNSSIVSPQSEGSVESARTPDSAATSYGEGFTIESGIDDDFSRDRPTGLRIDGVADRQQKPSLSRPSDWSVSTATPIKRSNSPSAARGDLQKRSSQQNMFENDKLLEMYALLYQHADIIKPRVDSSSKQQKLQATLRELSIPAHVTKSKKPNRKQPQIQWRVPNSLPKLVTVSPEQIQFERVMSNTVAYYRSSFEGVCASRLKDNPNTFDLHNDAEVFSASTTTIAALIEAGKHGVASGILDKTLSNVDKLFQMQHPQIFFVMADVSFGNVPTPVGRLRAQIKPYVARMAESNLGPDHPLTVILKTELPGKENFRLHEALQKRVQELLIEMFGPDAYQTTGHRFFLSRILSQMGLVQEASGILSALITQWEHVYGLNSLIVVIGLIEQTNYYLANGQPNIQAECLICDALRRVDIIWKATQSKENVSGEAEARHRANTLVFVRIGSLRTMGKLHLLRKNFAAAIHHIGQAIEIGTKALGADSSVVQLARSDYDTAKLLDLEYSMKLLPLTDRDEPLGGITNITTTAVT